MFYNSAEVDEDLRCSFCKLRFTDVIKLVPDCGESICGECHEELQDSLDSTREFTCKTCQETHVMPAKGLPDNRSLSRLLKKRKIEKPISDQAKRLKEKLTTINESLTTLNRLDPRDHVNDYCDNLECQVVEAFESAIGQLQRLQTAKLKQIQDWRRECLESCLANSNNQLRSGGENRHTGQLEEKLRDLNHEVADLTKQWTEYFTNPETLATDADIHLALEDSSRLDEMLGSLRSSMTSQIFQHKLMTFKPNYSIFEDQSKLEEHYNFKLEFEPPRTFELQPAPSSVLRGHTDAVFQVLSISAGRLASCSKDQAIKVWDARNGAELFELRGHLGWVTCLARLSNGWLASGSADRIIRLWDLNEKREVGTLKGHTMGIGWLQVLKNGNLASYSGDDTIKIWDPYRTTGNLLMTMTGHGNRTSILPFGKLSNDYLATVTTDDEPNPECIMRVWDPSIGQMVKAIRTGQAFVRSLLALSNDQVALGFTNGTIKLIDWTDDAKSRTKEKAHTSRVYSFAQLSNGCLLSAGHDAPEESFYIKMWHLGDFSLLQTILTGHSQIINSLSPSADERIVASASRDSTVKLWPIMATAL